MTANPHLSTETAAPASPGPQSRRCSCTAAIRIRSTCSSGRARLELDDRVAYVLPRAAERSWYPGRFHDPMEDNEPWLGWSLQADRGGGRARPRSQGGRCQPSPSSASRRAPASSPSTSPGNREPYGAAAILTGALFGTAGDRPAGGLAGRTADVLRDRRGDDWISG
jgi:hypothetical protein